VAIGKKGQNVRLASRLTGWHLEVTSETRYSKSMQEGYDSLIALPGVGISLADALYEKGFYSSGELTRASVEDLIQIRGIGEGKARKLIDTAQRAVEADMDLEEEAEQEMALENDAESIESDSQGPTASDDQENVSDENVSGEDQKSNET
jgi:N utilization substance protein A